MLTSVRRQIMVSRTRPLQAERLESGTQVGYLVYTVLATKMVKVLSILLKYYLLYNIPGWRSGERWNIEAPRP